MARLDVVAAFLRTPLDPANGDKNRDCGTSQVVGEDADGRRGVSYGG